MTAGLTVPVDSSNATAYLCPGGYIDLRDKAKLGQRVAFYQKKSAVYIPGYVGFDTHEVTEVTLKPKSAGADEVNLTLKEIKVDDIEDLYNDLISNNEVNASEYFVRLVDAYGNWVLANASKVTYYNGAASNSSLGDNISITYDKTRSNDTVTVAYGTISGSLNVNIDWGLGVDHIVISAGSTTVLANSWMPVSMKLVDAEGNLVAISGNYTVLVDNPSLVTLYNSTDEDEDNRIASGGLIEFKNGVAQLYIKSYAQTGEFTLTVRNTAGTVTGNKTFTIVESVGELVTCDAEHLDLCVTETDCTNAGGYWYDDACHAEPQAVCDAEHLDLCTTEEDCTGAGGYWYDNSCHAEPQAVCDAEHLDLCTTEEDCANAGGYWYDDACHAEPKAQPVPSEPVMKEITEVSPTPTDEQPFAAGDVAGGKMAIAAKFPRYAEPVDIYLAVLLPDGTLVFFNEEDQITKDFVAWRTDVTESVEDTIIPEFPLCAPFTGEPVIPTGDYYFYSLVVPAGTDVAAMDWQNDAYDLKYFKVTFPGCGE